MFVNIYMCLYTYVSVYACINRSLVKIKTYNILMREYSFMVNITRI